MQRHERVDVPDRRRRGVAPGRLVLLDAGGEPRWATALAFGRFPPAVGGDHVVVPGRERVLAFDAASGERLSAVPTPGGPLLAPTLDGSRAYVGTFASGVLAVDVAAGEVRWRAVGETRAYPPTVAGGVAYVTARETGGRGDGLLVALDAATGEERWRTGLDGDPTAPPGIHGGVVYVGSRDRRLYALSLDGGRVRFRVRLADWVDAPPAVGHGAVFVADQSGRVYAVVGA